MKKWLVVLMVLGLLGACDDGDGDGGADTTMTPDVTADQAAAPDETSADLAADLAGGEDLAGGLGFGAACTGAEDCESGVCHTFGQGGSLCTLACTDAAECPEGSEGPKCNQKGVCKP